MCVTDISFFLFRYFFVVECAFLFYFYFVLFFDRGWFVAILRNVLKHETGNEKKHAQRVWNHAWFHMIQNHRKFFLFVRNPQTFFIAPWVAKEWLARARSKALLLHYLQRSSQNYPQQYVLMSLHPNIPIILSKIVIKKPLFNHTRAPNSTHLNDS